MPLPPIPTAPNEGNPAPIPTAKSDGNPPPVPAAPSEGGPIPVPPLGAVEAGGGLGHILTGSGGITVTRSGDTVNIDGSGVSSGVTSVGGTAPIASSGGATPTISITAATDGAAGSMSAADKTKLDGITSGAAVASVGGTAPIVSSGGTTPTISITAATDGAAGSMSAADKTKLDAISGVGGGWATATDVSFAGVSNPGLSANGTYTLAGIAGVKRENAANDRVAMTINSNGIVISPGVSSYAPQSGTRTAPLLWFPFSSILSGVALEPATSLRLMLRINSSSQSAFDNGHGVICGIDNDNATGKNYALWGKQGTNTGSARSWFTGYKIGNAAGTQNQITDGVEAMSTGAFVMVVEIPYLMSFIFGALNSYQDGAAAWPNMGQLTPTSGSFQSSTNTADLRTANPSPAVNWLNMLGLVIAADSPASANDAYVVTVSNMRIDYRL